MKIAIVPSEGDYLVLAEVQDDEDTTDIIDLGGVILDAVESTQLELLLLQSRLFDEAAADGNITADGRIAHDD